MLQDVTNIMRICVYLRLPERILLVLQEKM